MSALPKSLESRQSARTPLQIALPKGRMQTGVFQLLIDAGVSVQTGARGYRPTVGLPNTEAKLLKPQNIVEMLDAGSRDLGFAGADWEQPIARRSARPNRGLKLAVRRIEHLSPQEIATTLTRAN